MRFLPALYLLLLLSIVTQAQTSYPQDYFNPPLNVPLVLSGTFGELRSNHFHAGLDIKTQQTTGLKVFASANGFVSRIKVSHFGYGKALYITHPNGYTTVYAHLQKFAPTIEAYVKKAQYKKESYEIELFPKAEELPVFQDSLVAYSGNSGGSGGPHLHFEIRDKNEHPMNPMLFGLDVKDTTSPVVKSIYAYPLDTKSFINQSNTKQKLRLIPLLNGDYKVENIDAIGSIGFGIETIDRQDLGANANGVANIQTFVNGSRNFELDFKRFSFNESKHINQLIDYENYISKKSRVQKLFKKNNPLSIIKSSANNGFIAIEDSTNVVYKIRVADYKNNEAWVTVHINGTNLTKGEAIKTIASPYFVNSKQTINLKKGRVSVDFYKDTFYENFYIDFDVKNDTLFLHDDTKAAKKNFRVAFDVSHYNQKDRNKLYIARLIGKKKYPTYTSTKRKGNELVTNTKKLGTYALALDTVKPSIKPVNFKNKQWLKNYRFLKIKIDDDASGISNFRATVNGKWILMEYDYKTKTLSYDFNDKMILDTKNNLKLIVTDNVGNNSTFETLFYKK
ncbi:M23 family metallopeptidase [Cognatitamlana onchidii]|uniref:M23 family metallopeptidase n=1 Tax=Cognatitamlana onchidii TaxID=2562860 RepID=UPI0010A60B29|nr:M23 family metallopeptidase [Algibacter onchidii]